ncbi:MAG: toll/interleukin-1 receptor domain-containing protein [Gemmatimonadales bacterium]
MDGFPTNPEPLRISLARALELKGWAHEADIVRSAEIDITLESHDNWNGGIDYYGLGFRVPLEAFAKIEAGLEEFEKRILQTAQIFWRGIDNEGISSVVVHPAALTASGARHAVPAVLPPFWAAGQFRLFLSHCSSQKSEMARLQSALQQFGVSAFVAHVDIEPTKEWELEIARGLQTMEALVAILTADFPESKWCDQEVGIALGQGKLVIPVRVDVNPYGFLAKHQALVARQGELGVLAPTIVELLLRHDSTAISMTHAIVRAFADSWNFAMAKTLISFIESLPTLSAEHAKLLAGAIKENDQVRYAWGVPDRVRQVLVRHGFKRLAA